MAMLEIIRRKRDGKALADVDIANFVAELANGSCPPEQAAALAMAIFLNGMNFHETAMLTRAMAASGNVIDWHKHNLRGPALDKHSTGGIGDKVSLILAPLVAACGGFVPMVAGRGLGHTGGTIDKLASIPGFRTDLPLWDFVAAVKSAGCAIVSQAGDLAPADGPLYAIRDVTATIESTSLITASILSKKLAAGVQALVMDIKTGNGAFMVEETEARALGEAIIGAGKSIAMDLPVRVVITDMSQTLGTSAGNALEVRECIDWLAGWHADPRLDTVTRTLAKEMLSLGGIKDEARRIETAISSGAAAEHFQKMVAAQGGPADLLDKPDTYLPQAAVIRPVPSPESGTLLRVNARAIGEAIVALGGGRRRLDDVVVPSTGYAEITAVGVAVEAGQPLAFVHAATEDAAKQGVSDYLAACSVGEGAPDSPELVRARLG
jgi:thymidine phosphorylase